MKPCRLSGLRAPSLLALAALALSASLPGCAIIDSTTDGERLQSLKGLPLGSIESANGLIFQGGNLIVANGGRAPGIAVVDTATGMVTRFYRYRIPPLSMVRDSAGRLLMTRTKPPGSSVLGWIDIASGQARDGSLFTADGYSKLTVSGGRTFLIDSYGRKLHQVSVHGGPLGTHGHVDFGIEKLPWSLAATNGKVFVGFSQSRFLAVLDSADLANPVVLPIVDSVDIAPAGDSSHTLGFYVGAMTAWNGYVFVAVSRTNSPQTVSWVAVIDAATRTLVKTIPLQFKWTTPAIVHDGIWYLSNAGDFQDWQGNVLLDGGVEAIDLTAQTHASVLFTEETLGGNVGAFVITGPGTGYAIYATGPENSTRRVRKVSF